MAGSGGGAASEGSGVLLVGVTDQQHGVVSFVDHLESENDFINNITSERGCCTVGAGKTFRYHRVNSVWC